MRELPARRKAAILCVALGSEHTARVIKQLPEARAGDLAVELARTATVDERDVDEVLQDFIDTARARRYVTRGGEAYAREVLERAVGTSRAAEILDRLAQSAERQPFEALRGAPPEQIYALVQRESPQMIALVIANLPTRELAAGVLQQFSAERQVDLSLRIAQLGQTSPDVLKEIAALARDRLDSVVRYEVSAFNGIERLAGILNAADRATERNVLERLGADDEELVEEVKALLFVFEDIFNLSDRMLQVVLRQVDVSDLALALRGTGERVRRRVVSNMSQRASELLLEEMENMPPQKRRVVEDAQSKLLAIVRKLEESGAIEVPRGEGGADDVV